MWVCIVHYHKKFIHAAQGESRNVVQGMEDSMGSLLSTSLLSGLCKGKAARRERQNKDTKRWEIEGLRSYKGQKNIEQTAKLEGFFFLSGFLVASDNITSSMNLGKNRKILTHITSKKHLAEDGCIQQDDFSRITISSLLCSIYLPVSLS